MGCINKVGVLLTGGEDSKINAWTCPSNDNGGSDEYMDIDGSPSRKRFVSGMDVDVGAHIFCHCNRH